MKESPLGRSPFRPLLGVAAAFALTAAAAVLPHHAAAARKSPRPGGGNKEPESALPGYRLRSLTAEEARQRAKKLISTDARVARAAREQHARLGRLGMLKPGAAELVSTAVTLVAVPRASAGARRPAGPGAEFTNASLRENSYLNEGGFEVTMISSQSDDTDFEYTPFVGTVYRRTPDGASDVWAAVLDHGEMEVTDLGSVRVDSYGARNLSPRPAGGPFGDWRKTVPLPAVGLVRAAFQDNNSKWACFRFESDLCRRAYNRDVLVAGGGVILGTMTCTGLTGGTLVTVCAAGGVISYVMLTEAARQTRNICLQNAQAKCYGGDAY